MFPSFRTLPKALTNAVEKHPILSIIVVIAYIASPIDVLPEIFLGPLGAFDDALVGIAAVSLLKRVAKARAGRPRATPPAPKPVPPPVSQKGDAPRQEKHQHWHGVRRDEGRGDRRPNDRRPDNRRPNDRGRDDRNRGGRPRPDDRP